MELDIRLMITLGGMLVSVAASFVLTRAKCVELEEDIKSILKHLQDESKRMRHMHNGTHPKPVDSAKK